VKALLKKYLVKPNKRRGQSFLTNQRIARDIVERASLKPDDTVLEIGGGLGILSKYIAMQAKHLYIIEIEENLVRALTDLLNEFENITVIHGDALKVDLPNVSKIVSNLPYSISSEITFRMTRELDFDDAILMFQKEFAERLVAQPCTADYSRLTIGISYLSDIEHLFDVNAQYFHPVPAVDSTVIRLTQRKEGLFAKEPGVFFSMIRGLYSYPNKQLRKALRIWFKQIGCDKEIADNLLDRVSTIVRYDERLRCIDLQTLIQISDKISSMIVEGEIPLLG
jgi:16S rRNA (adenine1518-N6/adenine1519-N6)-dimethyltransferase